MTQEVTIANKWYQENGMIVNPDKHQAMIIGNTEHTFSFPLRESIDLFGVTLDNELNFNAHICRLCKKINNQCNVIIRNRKLISSEVLLKLYKAFIYPHFQYCGSVWHFCGSRNAEKLETLNKRVLRVIFKDYTSTYTELVSKAGTTTLMDQRVRNMLISVFKSINY